MFLADPLHLPHPLHLAADSDLVLDLADPLHLAAVFDSLVPEESVMMLVLKVMKKLLCKVLYLINLIILRRERQRMGVSIRW
jgi:hypothetical protein